MAELLLIERNGEKHRVSWVDAPDEFWGEDLPAFSVQTRAEQALGVTLLDPRRARDYRRRFLRIASTADPTVYREG